MTGRAMLVAGAVLIVSLLLPWSAQVSPALRARFGATAALAGVASHPTAWQVYSGADVLLCLLGVGLMLGGLSRPGRVAAGVLCGGSAIGLAFGVHALGTPPTNGVDLPGVANPVGAGVGVWVAVVALAIGLAATVVGAARPPATVRAPAPIS